MQLRINDVTVSPDRIDELADVLANKALPVVAQQRGNRGLLCAADRATGNCAIVSFWDSRAALDASEAAISSVRSETVDAVGARLNSITIAEVLREVGNRPSKAGNRSRVVRVTAPAGSADALVEFYLKEAVPRLESQKGFLNARLIREIDDPSRFAAVSHWTDSAAVQASEATSETLRTSVTKSVPGARIETVTTPELVLVELTG